jgi:transcriptional regulator with XRE-family HTH domain
MLNGLTEAETDATASVAGLMGVAQGQGALTDEQIIDRAVASGLGQRLGQFVPGAGPCVFYTHAGYRTDELLTFARALSPQPPSTVGQTTLHDAIAAASERYGSMRKLAEAIGVDVGYLSRLASGEKAEPSAATLASLGLERVVTYRAVEQKENGK